MKNPFIEMKFKYTMENLDEGKRISFEDPSFVPISRLYEEDVVLIPVPFTDDIEFVNKRWEISGDYCVFFVDRCEDHWITLIPVPSMKFRNSFESDENVNYADYAIKIPVSDNLIMIRGR